MSRFARRLQQQAYTATRQNLPKLYMSPVVATYSVGSTVTIVIREDSKAVAVNAVQANLSYPTAQLRYESTNLSASAFTTTVENSGGSGAVRVAATLLGGTVTGDQLVATVTFTAVGAGQANVSFVAGSAIVSAADSTDVSGSKQGVVYTIT